MDINNRIRAIRRTTNLTQAEFGSRLGVSRDTIANMENGRMNINSLQITSICREFHVSEPWLRSGDGEMFVESSKEDQLMEWAGDVLRDRDEAFRKRFVTMLSQLPPEGWKWLEWMTMKILEEHNAEEQKKSPATELDIDQEVEAYRAELEAQRGLQAGSSPSGTGSEIIA